MPLSSFIYNIMCNFAPIFSDHDVMVALIFIFFRCFKQDERNYKDHSTG